MVSHQKAIFLLIPRSLLRGVFIFRDAKQYWGLEDFMNVTPTGVTNAANLSLFMVNVSYRLRADVHPCDPAGGVSKVEIDENNVL